MCGVVGYAGKPGGMNESLLREMCGSIAHRGPDGSGIWQSSDGAVMLGHRRLAILDLSPSGAQPMTLENGRFAIVFNGEIYNHEEMRRDLWATGTEFRGRSDTEVLLAAYRRWGEKCLQRLRGMFAFAVYDAERETVLLARDRAGEKPLYYTQLPQGILFASELKALFLHPAVRRVIDPSGLEFFLSYGYVPAEHTIVRGIRKVMPAHYVEWSLRSNSATTSRYWDVPEPDLKGRPEKSELAVELHQMLNSTVAEQLQADVPVAILLSGGVDSSLVTAIAASVASGRVRTYTVSMRGHEAFDESRYARRVAEYFSTDHVELPLDGSSVEMIALLSAQFDEPIGDSSMIPTFLLSRTVARQCKVVLGGDGGDELFGGYTMYQGLLTQQRLRKLLPQPLRWMLAFGATQWLPPGANRRNGLIGLKGNFAEGIAQTGIRFTPREIRRLSPWLSKTDTQANPKEWRRGLVDQFRGVPGAAMVADFRSYLPEDILVKVDRASMLCSLEVRAPFLDHRIIEFAYRRIPNEQRVTSSARKIVLKELAKQLLPRDLDLNRKQGFSIPLSEWLTPAVLQEWSDGCREQIGAVLSQRAVVQLTKARRGGTVERIFALMLLTMWMRHYGVSI